VKERSIILDKTEINNILKRLAYEIIEKNKKLEEVCFLGIKSRGVPMAFFISEFLERVENIKIPVGIIDIKLYRDDLSKVAYNPILKKSKLDFDITNKNIILVDDVLYTGKTVHSAINFLLETGKPSSIQLCVLIDRGHHKLPIKADYTGKNIPTNKNEVIKVNLMRIDNQENVKIMII